MQSARGTVNKVILQSARKPLILPGKQHFARDPAVQSAWKDLDCTVHEINRAKC